MLVALGVLAAGILYLAYGATSAIDDIEGRPVAIATLPCQTRIQATSSGFVIDDERVITVAHALFESRDFAVLDTNGTWRRGTIRYMDLERDLAVLHVPGLAAGPVTTRVAEPGDPVRMLGGAASGTSSGEVLRRVRITTEVIGDLSEQSQRSGYELSVEISSGDSGAAVVDEDDNLIGLVFARPRQRNAAWATSITEIDAVRDLTGVPTWDCAPDPEAELVLEPAQAIVN